MSTAREERSLRWGQARDQAFLSLKNASLEDKISTYRQLEKKMLKEATTNFERREIKRRITTDLLQAASPAGWSTFAPYLRRMESLGYVDLDERLLVCVLTAKAAAGTAAGMKKTADLIVDIERRTRS